MDALFLVLINLTDSVELLGPSPALGLSDTLTPEQIAAVRAACRSAATRAGIPSPVD